jgi:threonylcarbamoyladenosine tRNA methylthiotransferase MtaB
LRILLDSIGCRLNQSEVEQIGGTFRQAGHELVGGAEQCDLAVVNTCTVTAAAAADSRSAARRIHRANPSTQIIVTGCWSTLRPTQALALPGVTRVVSNADKERLVPLVLDIDPEQRDLEPVERGPLPGIRMRTRAFVKAQDGCDNRCAFCQTRVARGPAHSLGLSEVLRRVRAAIAGGAQEIVLTGVQLTGYGRDLDGHVDLSTLVKAILSETSVARLRLSSLEPWGMPKGFFSLWADSRLCRQLHLPLQSGSAATLRRMRRPVTPERFTHLVDLARAAIPDLALTTDLIAGFPGETDGEFEESLAFVRRLAFARAHVFTYSPRSGTPAAGLPDQIDPKVAKERARLLRAAAARSELDYRRRFIGKTLGVLWERAEAVGPAGWQMSGMTDNYLRVSAVAPADLWNRLSLVKLAGLQANGLRGDIV